MIGGLTAHLTKGGCGFFRRNARNLLKWSVFFCTGVRPRIKSEGYVWLEKRYARARSLRKLCSSTGRSGSAMRNVAPIPPSTK